MWEFKKKIQLKIIFGIKADIFSDNKLKNKNILKKCFLCVPKKTRFWSFE